MSWVDRELRRRQKAVLSQQGKQAALPVGEEAQHRDIPTLWRQIEQANQALPPELRLFAPVDRPASGGQEAINFVAVLVTSAGAGIGCTGEAIRYFWPQKNLRKSNNFWIKRHPQSGYRVSRRLKGNWSGPQYEDRPFDERTVTHIVKCLVTGKRVTFRSVRRKRLWVF